MYSSLVVSRLLEPITKDISFLNGQWLQIYNSKYVQESSEIDWDCVEVSISTENNRVNITKSAILHNHKNLPTFQTRIYQSSMVNDSIILTPISISSSVVPTLEIKYEGIGYLIITGLDYLTMYVWVQNYNTFFNFYNSEALDLLKSFNYTTYYKYPKLSYHEDCLEG
jgi:hypothetical protein